MSKATRQAPSELLGIKEWASQMLGMPDIWTPIQFDAAVSYFGVWMDNKLNEYDYDKKPPRPKYDLKDLLSDRADAGRDLSAYRAGKGVGGDMSSIRRRKKDE